MNGIPRHVLDWANTILTDGCQVGRRSCEVPARGHHETLRRASSLPGLPTPRLGRGHRAPYEPLAVSVRTGGSDSRVVARAGESSTGSPEWRSYEARAAARAAMSRTGPAILRVVVDRHGTGERVVGPAAATERDHPHADAARRFDVVRRVADHERAPTGRNRPSRARRRRASASRSAATRTDRASS